MGATSGAANSSQLVLGRLDHLPWARQGLSKGLRPAGNNFGGDLPMPQTAGVFSSADRR